MTQQRIQIDEIGTLFNDLVMAGEAAIVPAAEPMPGWHVNATHPVPGWGAWRVTPSTPRRLFDGGETVFYAFAHRAEYLAALGATDLTIMPSAPVPAVVTMRQARLALLGAGLLASVDAAIAALPEPGRSAARIEWEYSQEVHRARPFVQSLGAALELSTEQMDALFIAAAAL